MPPCRCCVEQAVNTYMENAVAMEEWDLRGLDKWAEAAEISLPISQWQRGEEEAEQEGDSLSNQINAVREQIQERLKRAMRNRPPADLIARIATREFERQIEKLSTEPKGELATALSWLDRALGVSLTESAAAAVIAEERGRSKRASRGSSPRSWPASRARTACASAPTTWSRRSCRWTWPRRSATSPAFATRSPGNTASRWTRSTCPSSNPRQIGETALQKIREAYDRREAQARRRAHAPDRAVPAPSED